MKRLKLLKPWHLPTVRLTLGATMAEPCMMQSRPTGAPGAGLIECAFDVLPGARLAVNAARPWEQQTQLRAPRGNGTFAGTVIPHTGCPHLSI